MKILHTSLGLTLAILIIAMTAITVLAHERREVDKYQLVVGFAVEPAIEAQKNGVSLRVTNSQTEQPVEGLQDTLKVEVTHVPSSISKEMAIRSMFGNPGNYTSDFIPTAPGQYRFRFFGAIEGHEIDETFQSGPDTFGDVQPSADLQFPNKLADLREVEAVARHVEEESHVIEESAQKAGTLATVGIVLGGVGIVVGGLSLVTRRRK